MTFEPPLNHTSIKKQPNLKNIFDSNDKQGHTRRELGYKSCNEFLFADVDTPIHPILNPQLLQEAGHVHVRHFHVYDGIVCIVCICNNVLDIQKLIVVIIVYIVDMLLISMGVILNDKAGTEVHVGDQIVSCPPRLSSGWRGSSFNFFKRLWYLQQPQHFQQLRRTWPKYPHMIPVRAGPQGTGGLYQQPLQSHRIC